MATFKYQRKLKMTPRGASNYSTVYIKQTVQEHTRLLNWLKEIADHIVGACEINASLCEWFTRPNREFKRSKGNGYYTPEDLIADMISQLSEGRDMPEAMIGRWNRLCEGTPWVIDFVHDTHRSQLDQQVQ